jgi:hypothetical protein
MRYFFSGMAQMAKWLAKSGLGENSLGIRLN